MLPLREKGKCPTNKWDQAISVVLLSSFKDGEPASSPGLLFAPSPPNRGIGPFKFSWLGQRAGLVVAADSNIAVGPSLLARALPHHTHF